VCNAQVQKTGLNNFCRYTNDTDVHEWQYFKTFTYGPLQKTSTQQNGTYFIVNCTDVHGSFNNKNHGNATLKTVLSSAQFTLIKFVPVHAMKAHRHSRGITPLILNLGTDGGTWAATCPSYYTLRETTPGTQ
jgi:hypothetical protein